MGLGDVLYGLFPAAFDSAEEVRELRDPCGGAAGLIDSHLTMVTGAYNAGRYQQWLGRELTKSEWDWFTDGWIPATATRRDT